MANRSSIYRLLHGAPMLAGIPAHYVLILLAFGTVFGLGTMGIHKLTGLFVLAIVFLTWIGLAFIYGQDRVRVPLMLLKLRYRFGKKINSYNPSGIIVRIEGEK